MPVPVPMPDLGSAEARVSLWHLQPGESVYEGDRLIEILLPGTTFDVPAPVGGIVRERVALPGDRVEPGQILGTIDPES